MNSNKWKKYLKDLGCNHGEGVVDFDTYNSAPILQDVKYTFNLDFKTVLCVGCGFGQEVFHFNENGYNAVGTTLSDEDITIAKEDLKLKVFKQDMHDLKFEDESFDLVFMRQVLEHSLSPYIALKEATRVSKKYVTIFLPYLYDWSYYKWHLIIPTKFQLETLMLKFNFKLVDHFVRIKEDRKWNDYCYAFKRFEEDE